MNCKEFQQNIDYLDAEQPDSASAEAWQAHLRDCPVCRAFYNDVCQLKDTLKNAELPPLPQKVRQMIYVQNDQPIYLLRWAAAAALLLITFSLGFMGALKMRHDVPVSVEAPRTLQTVVMAIESVSDRHDVTLRLLLPSGVEVEGHPGVATLEWRDDLSAGVNRLRIPLIVSGEAHGTLIAQVEYDERIEELKFRLGDLTEAPQTNRGKPSPRRIT